MLGFTAQGGRWFAALLPRRLSSQPCIPIKAGEGAVKVFELLHVCLESDGLEPPSNSFAVAPVVFCKLLFEVFFFVHDNTGVEQDKIGKSREKDPWVVCDQSRRKMASCKSEIDGVA